jgi:single-stranded DNA-binding protein
MLNVVTLQGVVIREAARISIAKSGHPCSMIRICNHRTIQLPKEERLVKFYINVWCFEQNALFAYQHIRKSDTIIVSGALQQMQRFDEKTQRQDVVDSIRADWIKHSDGRRPTAKPLPDDYQPVKRRKPPEQIISEDDVPN